MDQEISNMKRNRNYFFNHFDNVMFAELHSG